MGRPVLLTRDYMKGDRARAVPDALYDPGAGGYVLPPDASDHAARIALRLFPDLIQNAELVARAAVQDVRPIDAATAAYPRTQHWTKTPGWRAIAARALSARGYTPHEYQRIDGAYCCDRLDTVGGAYVGHEPGLGKSFLSCLVMGAWECNFVLLACPNACKQDPWLNDLAVYCPWMEPVVIGNSAKDRRERFDYAKRRMDSGDPTIVICHYEALNLIARMDRKDGSTWGKLGKFDLRVADEAHRLKNTRAGFSKAFGRIDAVGTLLLSGSCTDGEFEDLFLPMKLMQPQRYRAKWRDWNDRFGDYVDGTHGRIALGVKPHRLDELRKELSAVLVVRRASDELSIPAPHVSDLSVPMLPAQDMAYAALLEDLFAELDDGSYLAASAGASLITALRRVTGGVPDGKGGYASAKLERLVARYADIGKQQRVVFTWRRELADQAAARLSAEGFAVARIHGGVPGAKRATALESFKARRAQIVVATMGTLGVGINLQQAAGVSFLEHSYSPKDNEQARDRVVRQGQTAHAIVEHYTCTDTADELSVLPKLLTKTLLRQLLVGR